MGAIILEYLKHLAVEGKDIWRESHDESVDPSKAKYLFENAR
jgi:hypothetical protein